MTSFVHVPVLLDAVLSMAQTITPCWLADCTVGGAGHAAALLTVFNQAQLLGLDCDAKAIETATSRLAAFAPRVQLVQARFSNLFSLMQRRGIPKVDILLADFGVSSHQLDTPDRGFSFRTDGPLDMRMDPSTDQPAWQILADISENELYQAIATFGEERYARRVAKAIVIAKPRTTGQLARLVRQVVPKNRDQHLDTATRTFQGIRMLVNREMAEINTWLAHIPQVLAEGGLVMAISFHSLEDRAVKQAFSKAAKGCICPPKLPVCACGQAPWLRILNRQGITASDQEIRQNPRARSARLRVAQRLAAPVPHMAKVGVA